ncbi:MAG TPA: diguanylate cyclase, partial [Gammaproteobacteria bacterium]|nr:diguanylate cyclase [Gammaproteobacteria bacterium]
QEHFIDHLLIYQTGAAEKGPIRLGRYEPWEGERLDRRGSVARMIFPPGLTEVWVASYYEIEGSVEATFQLYEPGAFERRRGFENFLMGAFYGGILLLVFYNLFLYFSLRDTAYLFYVTYLASLLFVFAVLNGWAQYFFWPDSKHLKGCGLMISTNLSFFFATLFTRNFLCTKRLTPRLDRFLLIMAGIYVLGFLLGLLNVYRASMYLTLGAASVFFLMPFIGVYIYLRGYVPARIYAVAWTFVAIGASVYALRDSGVLPFSDLTSYGVQFGSWIEAALLSLALADRINLMRLEMAEAETKYTHRLEAEVTKRTGQLEEAVSGAEKMARTDVITGLGNRRVFYEKGAEEVRRARRYDKALTLVLLDIDEFKGINDTYGHAVGDAALAALGKMIRQVARKTDITARIGGEEFALFLPETSLSEGIAIAERLRAEAADIAVHHGGSDIDFTASFGVAELKNEVTDLDELFSKADAALYRAKEGGRDRVCAAD